MTTQRDRDVDTGLGALLQRPLLSSIWGRRTHRVSRGSSVEAGNAYYEKYFRNGMTEAHEMHDQRWHPNGTGDA